MITTNDLNEKTKDKEWEARFIQLVQKYNAKLATLLLTELDPQILAQLMFEQIRQDGNPPPPAGLHLESIGKAVLAGLSMVLAFQEMEAVASFKALGED